jgi:hypothetical protein
MNEDHDTQQSAEMKRALKNIAGAITRLAAACRRPVDDDLLRTAAERIVHASGWASKEAPAEMVELAVDFTEEILRDVVRKGECRTGGVLIAGRRAFHTKWATVEHWVSFSHLCQQVAPPTH